MGASAGIYGGLEGQAYLSSNIYVMLIITVTIDYNYEIITHAK